MVVVGSTTCFWKQPRLFIFNSLWLGREPHSTSTSSSIFPWSSHLLLPGNPILFGVCDEGHSPSPHCSRAPPPPPPWPPCEAGPGMSRYTLGETREWGGFPRKKLQSAKEEIKQQLSATTNPPHTHTHTPKTPSYFSGVPRGREGREQGKKGKGRPAAQWWLRHLVIIAGQAHSTVSSVPPILFQTL